MTTMTQQVSRAVASWKGSLSQTKVLCHSLAKITLLGRLLRVTMGVCETTPCLPLNNH